MIMGESPTSRLNSNPLSSLRPITMRSRTNSTTSLSSLPSCVSLTSIEPTPGIPDHDDGTSSHNDDYAPSICSDQGKGQYRRKSMTRRASTSMLPPQCLHGLYIHYGVLHLECIYIFTIFNICRGYNGYIKDQSNMQ